MHTEPAAGPDFPMDRRRLSWPRLLRMLVGAAAAILLILVGVMAFRSQSLSRQLQPQVRPVPAVTQVLPAARRGMPMPG